MIGSIISTTAYMEDGDDEFDTVNVRKLKRNDDDEFDYGDDDDEVRNVNDLQNRASLKSITFYSCYCCWDVDELISSVTDGSAHKRCSA